MAVGVLRIPQQAQPIWKERPEDGEGFRRIFDKTWWNYFRGLEVDLSGAAGLLRFGTYQDRLALTTSSVANGSVFIETDRGNLEYQMRDGFWTYIGGTYQRLQSELAALAATLTDYDTGLLVEVTDYAHTLRWTGTAWESGEGAWTAGQVSFFDAAPSPLTGWKLVDGTGDNGGAIGGGNPIAILKPDGTTRNNTTAANMTAGAYLKGAAAYNGAVTPAVAPTIAGSTASASAVIGNDSGAGVLVTTSGALSVSNHPHVHTDAGHLHGVGTLVASLAGGDPVDHVDMLPYIRK